MLYQTRSSTYAQPLLTTLVTCRVEPNGENSDAEGHTSSITAMTTPGFNFINQVTANL